MEPKDRIIVALDVDTTDKALDLVMKLGPYVGCFKIGLEFINSMLVQLLTAGSEVETNFKLNKLRALFNTLDGNVFWDGKFHDIPNTIAGASKAVSRLNVKMFNVHASAGIEAMQAAVMNKSHSIVLAVTVLTSLEENNAHLIFGGPTKAKVLQFARDAKLAGCNGIVCSPQELKLLGKQAGLTDLLKVIPGIRAADAAPDDQKRTMTADEAIKAGADYLVIGRPITGAPDPVVAAKKFAGDIAKVL